MGKKKLKKNRLLEKRHEKTRKKRHLFEDKMISEKTSHESHNISVNN